MSTGVTDEVLEQIFDKITRASEKQEGLRIRGVTFTDNDIRILSRNVLAFRDDIVTAFKNHEWEDRKAQTRQALSGGSAEGEWLAMNQAYEKLQRVVDSLS